MKIKEIYEQYANGIKSAYYAIDSNTNMCVMYVNHEDTAMINENTVVVPSTASRSVKVYIFLGRVKSIRILTVSDF